MGFFDRIRGRRGRQESDQLPEEGPAEQVVDDLPREARPEATKNPGSAGRDEERRTGHPDEARDSD